MFLRQMENMHCSYNPNIAASLLASSPGSGVGRSFCSDRSLIVKIKAHVFLKYQLGAESCLGSPPPNTHTVRMYAGIGRRHMREGRGKEDSAREAWRAGRRGHRDRRGSCCGQLGSLSAFYQCG